MEFERPEKSFGYCIFCEDIRQEVYNKVTFVGVFNGPELNVLGTLPANIGKFCIHAVFKQRVNEGIEPLTFEVHAPGDDDDKPTARIEAPSDQILAGLPPPPTDNDDPFLQISTGIIFNPLELRQEGILRVSVLKGGKRYKIGTLRVNAPGPGPAPEAAH